MKQLFFAVCLGLVIGVLLYVTGATSHTAAVTLYLSPTGSDANPCTQAAPCVTFNHAYQVAQTGDTIVVNGGGYQADWPAEGAAKILSSGSGATGVTFVCADVNNPVWFNAPADQLVITARHLTLRGGCFYLNRLWVGDGSNGVSTDDVTVDGVSMMSFDIAGSSNVTVENSTVGPDVACYAPGQAASCQDNHSTGEAYFFESGRPNTEFEEPKVHYGGPGGSVEPTNVLLLNDTFTTIQTRDPVNLHTGCLWLGWGSAGSVTVRGSRFSGCAIYDIHIDTPATQNVTLDGNTFAHSVEPVGTGSNWTTETATSQTDLQLKCLPSEVVSGYTITGNTFDHGWDLDFGGCANPTYQALTITGNTGGLIRNPAETGTPSPPPTTTATTATTTTSTTTTGTTTTPAETEEACDPVCDSLIASYQDKISRADTVLRDSSLAWKTRVQRAQAILES